MVRTQEEYARELDGLDAAHAQNEAGRDAFIALAHTALFAASISFVGEMALEDEAIWRLALILGWLSSVVGLLTLTVSFAVARKTIDARREALNDQQAPDSKVLDRLNAVALWSFPAALLCLFAFATANVVNADARRTDPSSTSSAFPDKTWQAGEGSIPGSASPQLDTGRTEAGDGRVPSPAGPGATLTATPSASATPGGAK